MTRNGKIAALLGGGVIAAVAAQGAQALVIVPGSAGWNTTNVIVGPALVGDADGASVVYDRDVTGGTAGASTYGQIAYGGGESFTPGIKVMNGPDQGAFPDPLNNAALNASNCIMASSDTFCDGDRQTGKRFKQQLTAIGSMDLVFNVDASDLQTDNEYRVFQRLVNQTGVYLGGFILELGFGVGADFEASTLGDGLSLSPRNQQNPTQFPFGLFGAPDLADGRPIGGFFDATERALFDTTFGEDSITTGDLLGSYDYYFSRGWVPQAAAPAGLLFDHDDDPATDALVMAFLNADLGRWERRRFVDESCAVATEVADPNVRGTLFDSFADISIYQNATAEANCAGDIDAAQIAEGPIEDVANLNVNYFIQIATADLWPTFDRDLASASFTMRVTSFAADTQVIPLPAAAPLLIAGLGGLVALRRRRRAA